MNRQYISAVDTAKLVRSALAESFPGVKFRVRSDRNSIDVFWTDGPTDSQVSAVCGKFRGGYFDGMIDYEGSVYHLLDGQPVDFGASYIFTRQEFSDDLLGRVLAACSDYWGDYWGGHRVSLEDWQRGNVGSQERRDIHAWLCGDSPISPYQGIEARESKTLARVRFDGSDQYGAPYGSKGYPRAA